MAWYTAGVVSQFSESMSWTRTSATPSSGSLACTGYLETWGGYGDGSANVPTVISVADTQDGGGITAPNRTGYDFKGWFTFSGSSASAVALSDATNLITSSPTIGFSALFANAGVWTPFGYSVVYAKWTPAEYLVVLDSNGGTLPSGTNAFVRRTYGSPYGTLPTPTRDGWTFDGWYTAATGGTLITPSTVVTQTTDHVIYAHWTEIPATVTITFDAAGGTVSETTRQVTSEAPYGALPTPTRSGYGFVGWFTEMSGGSQVTASTVATDDAIVYAHWSVSTCTVTFDGNGGTPSASSKTYLAGMAYGSLPTASRTGYNFAGWFTAATGGSQVTASSTASARTLYAHWAERAGIGVMFYKANS